MARLVVHILGITFYAVIMAIGAGYEVNNTNLETLLNGLGSGIAAAYFFYLASDVLPRYISEKRTAKLLCDSTRILADSFDKISLAIKSRKDRLKQPELIKISQIATLLPVSEFDYRRLEALARSAIYHQPHFLASTPLAISLGLEHAEQWLVIQDEIEKLKVTYGKIRPDWFSLMSAVEDGTNTDVHLKTQCKANERDLGESCKSLLQALIDWHKLRHCKPSYFEKLTVMAEHTLETYRSLITISIEYFKSLLLLNGGALIALLAYLGQAQNGKEIAANAGCVASYFIAGCVFSVASLICSYATQFQLFRESRDGLPQRHHILLWVTLIVSIVSLVLFGIGAYSCIGLIAGKAS